MTGYVLAKDAWAMVELSRQLRLARIYAFCHADHDASIHVLEKCGFTRDAGWAGATTFPNLPPGASQEALCYERIVTGVT
jgi:RimJ/RimL family protein N-acetyltransferase